MFYGRPAPKQVSPGLVRHAFDATVSFSYNSVMDAATAIFALVSAAILVAARLQGSGILGGQAVVGYTRSMRFHPCSYEEFY